MRDMERYYFPDYDYEEPFVAESYHLAALNARDEEWRERIEALAKEWEGWDGMKHSRYITELRSIADAGSGDRAKG